MKTLRYLLFLFFLGIISSVSGQKILDGYTIYNYSVKEGLPTNQVHCCVQDSKGYLWFGTGGGGVSRFNGREFTNYDMSNGMSGNEIYDIYEDKKGRVWFGTFSYKFCYFKNDSIYKYQYNKEIQEALPTNLIFSNLYVDEKDTLFIGFTNYPIIKVAPDGEIFSPTQEEIDNTLHLYSFNDKSFSGPSFWTKQGKYKRTFPIKERTINKAVIRLGQNKVNQVVYQNIKEFTYTHSGYNRISIINKDDNLFIFEKGAKPFRYDLNKNTLNQIELYDQKLIDNLVSVKFISGMFWFQLHNNGVVRCDYQNGKLKFIDHIFKDDFITNICEDRDKGLWLTSHKLGIHYIPHSTVKNKLKSEDWQVTNKNLLVVNDSVYLYAKTETEIVLVDGVKESTLEFKKKRQSHYITDFLTTKNQDSLILMTSIQAYITSLIDPHLIPLGKGGGKQMINANNRYYTSTSSGCYLIDIEEHSRQKIHNTNLWANCLSFNDNKIFLGSNQGVFVISKSEEGDWKDEGYMSERILKSFIMDFESYKNGLWIASRGFGVIYYKDSIVKVIDKSFGLQSLQINDLHQEDDTLWVATNDGLGKIIFDDQINVISSTFLDQKIGLSSEEVFGVETSDNKVFISTRKSLNIIDKSYLEPRIKKLPLEILRVETPKNTYEKTTENLVLKHDENDLKIDLEQLDYSSLNQSKIRYKLIPISNQWKIIDNPSITFNNLNPNNYSLEIEIQNEFNKWTNRRSLKFQIKPPYWETWWFLLIIILVLLLFTWLVIQQRIRKIRSQVQYENQIKTLRERALRTQVNPHFIFNTLNSIQHFVLKGDIQASNKYISKFSKLIRNILSQSEKDQIRLNEEILALKNYLDIEQMRFDHQFNYTISNDGFTPSQFLIPCMLVQPFVENAIWHGLMNKKDQGMIKINFEWQPTKNHIVCIVEDDGIGREAAKLIQNPSAVERKSIGMSLTAMRLKALSKNSDEKVEILDLTNEQNEAIGTKVTIYLPCEKLKLNESSNY